MATQVAAMAAKNSASTHDRLPERDKSIPKGQEEGLAGAVALATELPLAEKGALHAVQVTPLAGRDYSARTSSTRTSGTSRSSTVATTASKW